jgi:von Willebrand factor type D domain
MFSKSFIVLAFMAMAAIAQADDIEDRSIVLEEETPPGGEGSGSGDPHFKTWTGDKFDYHGECDLVLVDNPKFADGLGMKVHVRTTRIKYFSFIEKVAVQIGNDVLEFSNDVANVMLNGVVAAPKPGQRKIFMGDHYEVIRYKKSVVIRLDKANHAKIDLIARKIGWPSVRMSAGTTDAFDGSLGLLGEYETGKKVARDGVTEMNNAEDSTDFALEWQVRDTEPMLFSDARVPQYPATCVPPAKMLGNRLGMTLAKKEAEKACAAWGDDIDDCIFDVIASRSILSAEEVASEE